jgi:hypothetical protein
VAGASTSFIVRLWLPDLPGTLGRVAAAIGSVGGDVVGIEILERGAGMAIDEVHVSFDDGVDDPIDALVGALRKVDGVAVEDVHVVDAARPDQSVAAVEVAALIAEAEPERRLMVLCSSLRDLLEGDWTAVIDPESGRVLASDGDVPELGWLVAFLAGARHLQHDGANTPSDVVWARFPGADLCVAGGRAGRAFRERERHHVAVLARVVGALGPRA